MKIVRRLIQDYWGILLILLAWQGWVVINQFNPIVVFQIKTTVGFQIKSNGR